MSFPVPLAGVGTLQEVEVPIISQSSCQDMYGTNPTKAVDILYDMICAGFAQGGKDSCQVLLDQPSLRTTSIRDVTDLHGKTTRIAITCCCFSLPRAIQGGLLSARW